MDYIVMDLEATCWAKGTRPDRMETIEIGAVFVHGDGLDIGREFSSFVRPVNEPTLSEFCRELTSIGQADVDHAPLFPEALASFVAWAGDAPCTIVSWGVYDIGQIRVDCHRHGIDVPPLFERHLNLKRAFSELHDRGPRGMKGALAD